MFTKSFFGGQHLEALKRKSPMTKSLISSRQLLLPAKSDADPVFDWREKMRKWS